MTPTHDLTLDCMIHDLNNVFQTLIEAAHLMADDPEWAPVSGMILRSIDRGREITSSLKSVNQPPAPLETILENAINMVRDFVQLQRRPEILFHCELDPGIVIQRSWAWERVLINLFFNSVRAMPDGGRIAIRAVRSERRAEIVITDEGQGIPPEILPSMFEAHVSTKSKGGLGLHIVQSIVRQENGEVSARNLPGGGAEFSLSFPLTQAQALAAHRG